MGMEITFEHSSETFVNIRSIQVEDLTRSALRHILVGFLTTCDRLMNPEVLNILLGLLGVCHQCKYILAPGLQHTLFYEDG